MVGLALRLAVSQHRRSPAWLLLAALTVASTVLLAGLAADHAVSLRNARAQARFTTPEHVHSDGTMHQHADQALKSAATYNLVGHDQLTLIASWAAPDDPPALPGLARNPKPGEVLVSPALTQRLQGGSTAEQLRARLAGRIVGELPPGVLIAPDELAAVVGYDPNKVPPPADWSPGEGPAGPSHLLINLTMVLIVVPSFVLVAVAARFNARRRSRRAATLRLLGASASDLALFAAAEAGVLALPAVVAAGILWLLLRPVMVSLVFGNSAFFAADLTPTPASALALVVVVPALAVLAALISHREVVTDPVGVVRITSARSMTARRLLPLLAGVGVFLLGTALWRTVPESALVGAEAVGVLLALVGFAVAGPYLIHRAARRLARRPGVNGAALVALRRLQRDPQAGFRTVSGLVLAAFVFGFLASLDLSGDASPPAAQSAGQASLQVELNGHALQPVWRELDGVPDVDAVAPIAWVPTTSGYALATTCEGLTVVLQLTVTDGRCLDGEALGVGQAALRVGQPLDGLQVHAERQVPLPDRRVTGSVHQADLPRTDLVLTLTAREFNTLSGLAPARVLVKTRDQAAELGAVAAAARSAPLAITAPPNDIGSPRLYGAVWSALLRLALLGALAVTTASLMVAIAEAMLDRRQTLAMMGALGMTPGDARRLTATEIALPVGLSVLPALVVGAAMSWTGGVLLSGATRAPWKELAWALSATVVISILSFTLLLSLVRHVPSFEILRKEA